MRGHGGQAERQGAARARVRALLRERERATDARVRVVLDRRERVAELRRQLDLFQAEAEHALRELVEMGYRRQEIAAMCDLPEDEVPRRRRPSSGRGDFGGANTGSQVSRTAPAGDDDGTELSIRSGA